MKYALILSLLIGCGKKSDPALPTSEGCQESINKDDSRPDILIIGDSISIGYTPTVKEKLPNLDIEHNPCNAGSSTMGVHNIHDYLEQRPKWDLVTFNHGIWDIHLSYRNTIEGYQANLRLIGTQIKARSKKSIFFTTTYIPKYAPNMLPFGAVEEYNEAAIEVMQELDIPVFDLYKVSEGITDLQYRAAEQDNVHWTAEGSEILGEAVVGAINDRLEE